METHGVVIEGTGRTDDLLDAFSEKLYELDPSRTLELRQQYVEVYDWLKMERKLHPEGRLDSFGDAPPSIDEKASYLVHEVLYDALNERAPEGFYFGTLEGDGSCYGFWKGEDDEEGAGTSV